VSSARMLSQVRRCGAPTIGPPTGRTPLRSSADYGDRVTVTGATETPSELERRFAVGDDTLLREAYERHGALVYNLCRRVVGDAHAADVSQEVWVSAWRSRERYDPARGSLAGWLVGIARFKTLDHLRRTPPVRASMDDDEGPAARRHADGLVASPVEQVAEQLLVADALQQLEPRRRAVVELAFYSDATHQEIAQRTGIPLGTVKSDIRRGLEAMRRYLEGFDAAARP
jgi:RNA polymerase sigma factor (sigma-70 family)